MASAKKPQPAAPERRAILAIDGGGIRGVLTLQVLKRIEDELRKLPGQGDTVLADHFDLVAGTSVGAIFASLIALRKPVAEIAALIEVNRDLFFSVRWNLLGRMAYHSFDKAPLAKLIRNAVGKDKNGKEKTLGDPALAARLLLVMRNATNDSPWILTSFPEAKFNERDKRKEFGDCNLDLPLWQLILASAAAPTYFAPEKVKIGAETFTFEDGALTGFNNPAFKAFQYVTTPAYRIGWPTDEKKLSVVSVGTGFLRNKKPMLDWRNLHKIAVAMTVPLVQISAADRETDVLCRTFGRCHLGDVIDSEVGDLKDRSGQPFEPLFSYYRFNISLDQDRLGKLGLKVKSPKDITRIDAVENLEALAEIGRGLAEEAFAGRLKVADMVRKP